MDNKLIVGLGNPGQKYETTRHNIGFLVIDYLSNVWNASGPQNKYQSELYQAQVSGHKIILAKPQTFMNNSGPSVQSLIQFYKIKLDDIIVIHDDLDLNAFNIRIKTGGGAGGHNGIKSIDQSLKSMGNDYHRIRIGIGKPENQRHAVNYVLEPFSNDEIDKLNQILDPILNASLLILDGNIKKAMNTYNTKNSSTNPQETI